LILDGFTKGNANIRLYSLKIKAELPKFPAFYLLLISFNDGDAERFFSGVYDTIHRLLHSPEKDGLGGTARKYDQNRDL
jgi:hypothetical protein